MLATVCLAAWALLVGAVLGITRSSFLVEDLAYLGTGGLGGLACLAVGGAVYVASRTEASASNSNDRSRATARRPRSGVLALSLRTARTGSRTTKVAPWPLVTAQRTGPMFSSTVFPPPPKSASAPATRISPRCW